jgi:2-polyprenyl-3-methyl-5-hydroxy-6-metoxy-1,4-benzoquinol methylase
MDGQVRRRCPICGGSASTRNFPYKTLFNEVVFDYVRCRSCWSVFVDPVPDANTLAIMYSKATYHDVHYIDCESARYGSSARLLRGFLPAGSSVLDYGCGLGVFLKALKVEGFSVTGVEFDEEAAAYAAKSTDCRVFSTASFFSQENKATYDALYLGDVLAHLPEPGATLRELLALVRTGGLLFVEGPLETNPSLVFWAARLVGAVKRLVRPNFIGSSPPTHLLRVNAVQQLTFFTRVERGLARLHWGVHETGWPYTNGGVLKHAIAVAAAMLGGRKIFGVIFGNRFRGVFRLPDAAKP